MPQPRLTLARAYRPRRLDDLIGQDVLVTTLKGAFANNRTAQAYLLTGPRGTGKTSTARILASCFNCASGPTESPCGDCEQCQAIARDKHLDVIEIDGATYTRVEDVRDLQDSLRYSPGQGRYKVVIVDEVHMLSKNAFNAFLKTLEEPPAHVVFIFATTEPRKIPATVLSRCQRFDLRPVEAAALAAHYRSVCEREGVTIDDAALALIADAARGSVRDGMSILDQAMSAAGDHIREAAVRDMLALGDATEAARILSNTMAGEPAEALRRFKAQIAAGGDPAQILTDMLSAVHAACLAATAPGSAEHAGVDPEVARIAEEIAPGAGARRLQAAWDAIAAGLADVRTLPDPARAGEMAVLRLTATGTE